MRLSNLKDWGYDPVYLESSSDQNETIIPDTSATKSASDMLILLSIFLIIAAVCLFTAARMHGHF